MLRENIRLLSRLKSLSKFWKYSTSSEITAGVIIIGDEILKGHTQDTNSSFFIKNLNSVGLKIKKISVLPDDIDTIAQEVLSLSNYCTVVLTSGGIGPTHDDVTYEAVAKACSECLVQNEELSLLYKSYFGPQADENPAVVKFSSIPKSAKLNFGFDENGAKIKFPLISVNNIYMLPGVPLLLPKSFEVFKTNFLLYNKPQYVQSIFLAPDEFSITPILNNAVNRFANRVQIGSYPSFNENYYKVKLVFESSNSHHIDEACNYIEQQLPRGSIVTLKKDLLSVKDLHSLCKSHPRFQHAILVVEEALKKYSTSEICICFNGGKDCTALLHLVYCLMNNNSREEWSKMHAFYAKNSETFDEVDNFINSCVQRYCLNLITKTGDLREGFRDFLQTHTHIKAAFVGMRRGDPGTENLEYFSGTDEDWPSVVRISPILDWSYKDVWTFIRTLQIPYCTLYDTGYTSLGAKTETVQNPALLRKQGFRSYNPAHLLKDDDDERNGRVK